MAHNLTEDGAVNKMLLRQSHDWWFNAAKDHGIDVSGLKRNATLEQRIAWALKQGLVIGTIYSRFSSKRQQSTADQVRTCIQHAASKGIYCPPEFICADEAQRGYRARRDGLERMLSILKNGLATVLLVFKASRLYRQAFKGYQLIQQEVVEEGLRAISVTQGIDTIDTKAWKTLFQVHGLVDDMQVEATADHVRAGLKGHFNRGYTVGALPVGYRRKEVPNGPLTNRGLPRTEPEIDPEAAAMIKLHFELINNGMPISHGLKKWNDDGGPVDPRSSSGHMTYYPYRRMLSRLAYTGRWEYGRKRNEFSTKLDYSRQIEQPDSEVEVQHDENLRIIDDELFYSVQEKLAKLKSGPRGPKKVKDAQLWDLVTECFYCAECDERFYQSGAGGKGMVCKNRTLCPCKSIVNRKQATIAICDCLSSLIQADKQLVENVICQAQEIDQETSTELEAQMEKLKRKISMQSNKIDDLTELVGSGNDDDRKEIQNKIKSAMTERTSTRHELSQLESRLQQINVVITPDQVKGIMDEFDKLLQQAAKGELGDESLYKAVAIFKRLTGSKVVVQVEQRLKRKAKNIRGVFHLKLLAYTQDQVGLHLPGDPTADKEISVWLRKPPRIDLLAERAHILIDVEKLSMRQAAKQLQEEGYKVNSGNVWYAYQRWYEMQVLPVPKNPYNNGHKRKDRE